MPYFRSLSALTFATLAFSQASTAADKAVSISELSWTDKQYMSAQIDQVDALFRDEFGGQIHQSKSDLDLLQRAINRGIVERSNIQGQQALGMVLGNVIAQETGMKWYAYKDEGGRSRALCVPDTEHCLFPVTMLSRRMSVGLYPNVEKIYTESIEMVGPHLKKSPYEVD